MDSYVGFRNPSEQEKEILSHVASCLCEDGFFVSQGIDQIIVESDGVRVSIGSLVAGHKRRNITISNSDNSSSLSQFSLNGNLDKDRVVAEIKSIMFQSGCRMPVKIKPANESQNSSDVPSSEQASTPADDKIETKKDQQADKAPEDTTNVYAEPIAGVAINHPSGDSKLGLKKTFKAELPNDYKKINAAVCELLENAEKQGFKLEITLEQIED